MRPLSIFILAFLITLGILGLLLAPTSESQTLGSYVPVPSVYAPVMPAVAAGCTYRVRPGDDLFRIGLRYGISFTYLASLNGIPNPNLIFAGSVLAVPCVGVPAPVPPANCAPSQSYTVVAGDNLFRIAYNFKTSLSFLRATNNMYGRVLRPGMVLTIPCPGSVQYAVVPPPGATAVPTAVPTAAPPTATSVPTGPTATLVPGPQILIQNGQFNPANITIQPGLTVTWVNQDSTAYTLTCPACTASGIQFTSPAIQPNGGTWSFKFDTIGTYDYQTVENSNIKGRITVQ